MLKSIFLITSAMNAAVFIILFFTDRLILGSDVWSTSLIGVTVSCLELIGGSRWLKSVHHLT